MNTYRYRSFINLNPKFQEENEKRIHRYYSSVKAMLEDWDLAGPSNDTENTIYRFLYEISDVYEGNRAKRFDLNINRLSKVINCRERHFCRDTSLCPVCLSHWRYGIASIIQRAVETNPKIRLVMRQETILMPRGVFHCSGNSKELCLMINNRLNPVYELPVGSKYSRYWVWKFLDDVDRQEYNSDHYFMTDRYDGVIFKTWKAIGGQDLVLSPFELDKYPLWKREYQENLHNKYLNAYKLQQENIKKGESNLLANPILVELMARMKRLDIIAKDSMGSVQRIMMIPSKLNDSTLLLRLDSLFLDTRDHYSYIKNKYEDELQDQKRFAQIAWPGWDGKQDHVWHPRRKAVMVCKNIPSKMRDILRMVESRFSTSCNLYPNLLVEEFPFFLNCFSGKQLTKRTGFFRDVAD